MFEVHPVQCHLRRVGFALMIVLVLVTASQAGLVFSYTGDLYSDPSYSVPSGSPGIVGDATLMPAHLNWVVSYYDDNHWNYSYTLDIQKHDVSHFITEVSTTFDQFTFSNLTGAGDPEVSWHGEDNGNPGIPTSLWGLKVQNGGGAMAFAFDTYRQPVWGDFFAKAGQYSVYNSGFTAPDWDPTVPAANGARWDLSDSGDLVGHLLVPDTTVVPLPGAVLLGLLGMSVAGLRLRKYA